MATSFEIVPLLPPNQSIDTPMVVEEASPLMKCPFSTLLGLREVTTTILQYNDLNFTKTGKRCDSNGVVVSTLREATQLYPETFAKLSGQFLLLRPEFLRSFCANKSAYCGSSDSFDRSSHKGSNFCCSDPSSYVVPTAAPVTAETTKAPIKVQLLMRQR
jgi:hypothetical protein